MSATLVKFQVRTDTAANWTLANPVLLAGEPGHETDTGKVKYGDGVRNWLSLPYSSGSSLASTPPPAVGSSVAGTSEIAARSDHSHALPSTLSATTLQVSGNATVGGTLTVSGSLVGGSHGHDAAAITGLTEAIEDAVAGILVEGSNISITHDDAAGTITIAGQAGGGESSASAFGNTLIAAETAEAARTVLGAVGSYAADQNGTAVSNIVVLTSAQYAALASVEATTLYIVTD